MSPRDRMLCTTIVMGGIALALLLYLYLPVQFPEPVTQASKPSKTTAQPDAPAADLWSWAKSEIVPHEPAPQDGASAKKANPVLEPEDEKSAVVEDADDDEPVDIYASCDPLEGEEAAACIERVDQRLESLRDACDKYDDDNEHWLECMDAANQSKDYELPQAGRRDSRSAE